MNGKKKIRWYLIVLLAVVSLLFAGCAGIDALLDDTGGSAGGGSSVSLDQIPPYAGDPYVVVDDNQPVFDEESGQDSFETYAELDDLGRCGTAFAKIGQDLMPTEKRGNISPVKPSGWQTAKYDSVEGKYLYNRCHLIGYQLSGENANERNLITGTRYFNVEGMLPFENQVAEYVRTTGNHVLYRVTPMYEGDDLVARGVQMEAKSVEDGGTAICFNVFAYNIQPGITIDYATGESQLTSGDGEAQGTGGTKSSDTKPKGLGKKAKDSSDQLKEYVLNTNTYTYHLPDCSGVEDMKEENKEDYTGTKTELEAAGYKPCGRCRP